MSPEAAQTPNSTDRRAALEARRARVLATWQGPDGGLDDGFVVIPSGLVLPVEGSDQHYGFRAHDDHYYLGGCRSPAQVLACDPTDGGWTLFAFVPSQDDRVWHGDLPPIEDQAAAVGIDSVRPAGELGAWLDARGGRPAALLGSFDLLERPAGYGLHPERVAALNLDCDLSDRLAAQVIGARRIKDEIELALMRAAAAASAAGHRAGMQATRPGLTERELAVEIETGFRRAGAERPAYHSIAVAGESCATLHATPGAYAMQAGDLVLVDAGAEVDGYDSDVTRIWPVSPAFSAEQRAIYEIVLDAQKRAVDGAQAGVEFRELHMQTCVRLAQGLVDFGLLRGNAEDLVAQDAHAVFFPHGLGHLIGLATHDVGGWPEGRERSERPGLKYLRIDLPLEEGYVVTIEPGVYFVRALIEDDALRAQHADTVNWEMADAMKSFGGVRIEDDVVIHNGMPEVLTADIPKEIDAVEALRA